jgi:tetratricopeptide (TPR) repeat protein
VAYVSAYLLPRGELGEAQSEIERAQHLDPLSPRVYLVSGRIQYYQRHYDEAIAQYRKALELDSRFSPAHLALASAYAAKFMYGDALAEVEEVKAAVAGDRELLLLGHTYAQMGKRAQAQAILERLEAIAKQRYVSAVHISELYADLGEKGEELAWLEKASQQRSLGFACLKLNPHFDGVRSDPRFIALLRRVGLQ